ncbi:glycine/D-amino acid oxidase-like deaminating enzyme [Alkalibacillus flavidus]|uniref:Glycine/D-amino acid oxidase-like deaminating enzyme n=1 Tax=Alkalibacillus flavidus TaxID=546021 RepID=A0ABV2KSZ2_9BACI
MSERILQTYRELAIEKGAKLKTYAQVQTIMPDTNYVKVELKDETVYAEHMIISAGKQTNDLLAMLGEQVPLTPTRKTFSWFHSDEVVYGQQALPGWAYDMNGQTYYGFPSIEQ